MKMIGEEWKSQCWYLVKIFCLLLLLASCGSSPPHKMNPVDVLFIAYDRGESNAFIQLEKQFMKQGVSYKILAIGPASDIFTKHNNSFLLPPFSLEAKLKHHRSVPLPTDVVSRVVQCCSPRIIYSGMASRAQAQLFNSFRRNGSYSIAFYDSFDSPKRQQYVAPFLQEILNLDEVHVPTDIARKGFLSLVDIKSTLIMVTGQPALEEWDQVYRSASVSNVRQQLGLSHNKPVMLFAGGYDNGYEKSFITFVQGAKQVPNIQFLVTHHPKYDGELENRIIAECSCNNVKLMMKGQATTAELSVISSAIITHQSTVGALALYKNKPVIYVADNDYTNFLLEAGIAQKASTPEQVVKAVMSTLPPQETAPSLASIGMPDSPAWQIVNRILEVRKMARK